jgi:hypothetical protein
MWRFFSYPFSCELLYFISDAVFLISLSSDLVALAEIVV